MLRQQCRRERMDGEGEGAGSTRSFPTLSLFTYVDVPYMRVSQIRSIYEGISMVTTSIRRIEEALIQLQYALGDYYTSREQNVDSAFTVLEAPLYGLRVNLNSALSAISHVAADPEIGNAKHTAR
jgi:hypothetical protein